MDNKEPSINSPVEAGSVNSGITAKKKKSKKKKPNQEHSILDNTKTGQMILKTALRNHLDLSSLADRKASTMLSINSLIITFALPLMINYIRSSREFGIPALMLLITCLISITYATLVTRPIKMSGFTDKKTVKEGKGDLFFFGNFFKMNFNDYFEGIKVTLENASNLDESIVRDLYSSGQALGVKYAQLRVCYTIFIIGLILSAIAFIVVFLMT